MLATTVMCGCFTERENKYSCIYIELLSENPMMPLFTRYVDYDNIENLSHVSVKKFHELDDEPC